MMNVKRLSQIVSLVIFCLLMMLSKEVKAENTSEVWYEKFDDGMTDVWYYEEYVDGTIGIINYDGMHEEIEIPTHIEGKKVNIILQQHGQI